jgi:cation:H+ antiporter
MFIDLLILGVGLVVILVGAELFTNGIEWFGHHLDLAEGAVGSVLAAVGTALPETMIPIIAILFGAAGTGEKIGVGAVLGAPFMLATLAMFVSGAAVLWRSRRTGGSIMNVDPGTLRQDLRYFAPCYALAIATAFLPPDLGFLRVLVAIVLIGTYIWYVKGHFEADPDVDAADLAPLRFHRLDQEGHQQDPGRPRLRIVNVQVVVALACIVGGAYVFVGAVSGLAGEFGLDEALLALVIAPIATELPEKFNSVIWIRQEKDTLAMGNITGAMVFQSAIPTVVALLFAGAAWHIGEGSYLAFASAGIAFLSVFLLFGVARRATLDGRRLLLGGVLYLVYVGLVVYQLTMGSGGVT